MNDISEFFREMFDSVSRSSPSMTLTFKFLYDVLCFTTFPTKFNAAK